VISFQLSVFSYYTQEGNKLDFLRNKNHLFKPQRGEINTAWGSAPGNPSYDHVEYIKEIRFFGLDSDFSMVDISALWYSIDKIPGFLR
jgi:hypothetical protein